MNWHMKRLTTLYEMLTNCPSSKFPLVAKKKTFKNADIFDLQSFKMKKKLHHAENLTVK